MEQQEYISGRGKASVLPPELRKWNWGAFLMNWIWGLGNNTFIALLCFVPILNIVMPFVLGAKGNQWAWQNNQWRDIEHFRKTQRMWAYIGLFLVVIVVALFATVAFVISQMDLPQPTNTY